MRTAVIITGGMGGLGDPISGEMDAALSLTRRTQEGWRDNDATCLS